MNAAKYGSLLTAIGRDLTQCQVGWALVGGLAVGTWCEPRFTRDIDVAVEAREGLAQQLVARGYELISPAESAVRLRPPGGRAVLDLLCSSTGIEAETVAAASALEPFPGVWIPVASIGHLIAMKLLARDDDLRPLDRLDLRGLLLQAKEADLAETRAAIALIEERGFARGRNLVALLASTRAEFRL